MGSQPAQGTAELPAPGVTATISASCPLNVGCWNVDVTADELHACSKRLKHGKSPGIDGILAEMIKGGGDLLQCCWLLLFNCMLASHFPECLSVGLITDPQVIH